MLASTQPVRLVYNHPLEHRALLLQSPQNENSHTTKLIGGTAVHGFLSRGRRSGNRRSRRPRPNHTRSVETRAPRPIVDPGNRLADR